MSAWLYCFDGCFFCYCDGISRIGWCDIRTVCPAALNAGKCCPLLTLCRLKLVPSWEEREAACWVQHNAITDLSCLSLLSLYLPISLSISICPYLYPFIPHLAISLSLLPSLFLSLSLSLSLPLSISLSLPLSFSLYLSLSLPISLSLTHSLSLSVSSIQSLSLFQTHHSIPCI